MSPGWRLPFALLVFAFVSPALAAPSPFGRDPAVEAQHEAEVPTRVERFRTATAALAAGQLDIAETAFREVLSAYPRHGATLWRLSRLALQRGDRSAAIALARQAVEAKPGTASRTTLAEALLMDKPDEAALGEAEVVLEEAAREAGDDRSKSHVAVARIELALKRNNMATFRDAVTVLRQVAPDEVLTHYFTAIALASRDDLEGAGQELDQAVTGGLPVAEADRLRDQFGITRNKQIWLWAKLGAVLLGLWLATLFLIFAVGSLLSRGTLQAIERFSGRDSDDLRSRTGALRAWYKRTIGFAAVYYFISIPVVIAVVLLLAGGILLGFLMLGRIPIKLVLIVAVVAFVSVWSMLKSLIVRRQAEEDPGRVLTESEAPALWAVLREVAHKVGTRPVDTVYLTVGTDMAVIERGSMSERLRDHGKRALILGVGLLPGFARSQFRAILAHEYGHFSNRDTAGGNVSMVVQASLMRSIIGIAQGGGAAFYNPAWLFVRGFYLLFLRITLGASRLQEIMADHFAAVAYGAAAFRDGLVHVARRSLEFSRSADLLVGEAQRTRRALVSVYAVPSAGLEGADLEAAFDERMKDKGSPYDSHPTPAQRLAWVSRVEVPPEGPADEGPVWELFSNRAAIEAEMTALANERLRAQGVIDDHAEGPAAPESARTA